MAMGTWTAGQVKAAEPVDKLVRGGKAQLVSPAPGILGAEDVHLSLLDELSDQAAHS